MENIFSFKQIKKIDLSLLFLVSILSVIGLANIFSTTYFDYNDVSAAFESALIYYSLGFSVLFIGVIFNFQILKNKYVAASIFTFTLTLLILVLFIGVKVGETSRWIVVGGFTIQPSEVAKLSLIILVSGIGSTLKSVKKWLGIGILFGIFAVLIYLQKSLGNTLLLTGIFTGLLYSMFPFNKKTIWGIGIFLLGILLSLFSNHTNLFAAAGFFMFIFPVLGMIRKKIRRKYSRNGLIMYYILILLFILGLSIQPFFQFSYNNLLRPYQKERIDTFLNSDDADLNQAENYQKTQALRAIGSAGIYGKGYLNSEFSNTSLLPLSDSDFAYAAVAEQSGFVGSVILLSIYGLLLSRILYIARYTKDTFGQYIIYGISLLIFLNVVQHIGMNIGILPITGVPLPFISLGGSALLTTFAGVALVLSVKASSFFSTTKVTKYV